jgi:hypoxanthine phosphoribosyltransferase
MTVTTSNPPSSFYALPQYDQPTVSAPMGADLTFWQRPAGVSVPFDALKFLYVTDEAEALMVADLARRVFHYQISRLGAEGPITKAVMITMGGLLPGVLLHDHLSYNPDARIPHVEFGTLGVQCYAGPGQPLETPRVVQDVTIDVSGHVVGVIEDLVDLGGTARFVNGYLRGRGAKDVVLIAPYLKNAKIAEELTVISFGLVPKDTWIITPRERVETLVKRVPHWRAGGATRAECERNLYAIGYPRYLIDLYLPLVYAVSEA